MYSSLLQTQKVTFEGRHGMGSDKSYHARERPVLQSPTTAAMREGAMSPGRQDSVCSDSDTDVPYVSYTVNKPIGESPSFQQVQRKVFVAKALEDTEQGQNNNYSPFKQNIKFRSGPNSSWGRG